MRQALAALFGAAFTVTACYATGTLVLQKIRASLSRAEQIPMAFTLGAACLHLVIFAIFYVSLTAGETLADDGIISAALAMWLPNGIVLVAGVLGANRMMWATDYPHIDAHKDPVGELKRHIATLAPAEQEWILGKAAAELYRL